jgi:uncharacterized protein DUF3313
VLEFKTQKEQKEQTEKMKHESKNMKLTTGLFSVVLAGILVAGCSQTAAPKPNIIQRVQGETPAPSGFLGSDYSLLTPPAEGTDQKAMRRYVAPNVAWSSYNKVVIAPVTFWAADDSKVSAADQQALCNHAYNEFVTILSKNFIITGQLGPGVAKLSVALTDATSAVPGSSSISVVVPHGRALSAIKMLATGSYAFVGSAQGAFKLNDSVSGQLLAAAVDKRVGGTSITNVDVFQWGDAQNAIDYCAKLTDKRRIAFGVQSSVAAN